jgi:hypothetical protein
VLRYDSTRLQVATKRASQVELDDDQEQLVRDLCGMVSPRIGIDPIPCRGLWLLAVKQWQVAHEMPASAISAMAPAERYDAALEIRDHFVRLTLELLSDTNRHDDLLAAVDEAFAMYLANYNRRSPPAAGPNGRDPGSSSGRFPLRRGSSG